jgi:jumonji domain-containing protein 2
MISEIDIPECPIWEPTPKEFENFAEYVEKLENDRTMQEFGMVKIIPPTKWKARSKGYKQDIDDILISNPIEQNVTGKGGIFELLYIAKKSLRIREYKKKVELFEDITEDKNNEEVEELFWKNISYSPPLYGADMRGSLFDDNVHWDLKSLPGILREGLKVNVPGVNDPYLYIGSWKTMFGWHKEDLDLYSINYLHTGKPKFWYCLPRTENHKLEEFAKKCFPDGFQRCREFMRHKSIMISPYILKKMIPDLKIHKMVQKPGEFLINFGGAYHCGFNWGFNIAEAVNFANPKWLDILTKANCCHCINDTVKIDKAEFFKNISQGPYAKYAQGKVGAIKKAPAGHQKKIEEEKDTHHHQHHHHHNVAPESSEEEDESEEEMEIEEKPTNNRPNGVPAKEKESPKKAMEIEHTKKEAAAPKPKKVVKKDKKRNHEQTHCKDQEIC